MAPVWLTHDNPDRHDYVEKNKYPLNSTAPELDFSDRQLNYRDGEVTITDRLCSLVTCGKKIQSLEVVSIYNAWILEDKELGADREPVYLVHFAVLSNERNHTKPLDDWVAHSYATHEVASHLTNTSLHMLPHLNTERTADNIDITWLSDEIHANVFLRLRRAGTEFKLPSILQKHEKKAIQKL